MSEPPTDNLADLLDAINTDAPISKAASVGLDAAYWHQVFDTVNALVADNLPPELEIPHKTQLFLDFAFVPHPHFQPYEKDFTNWLTVKTGAPEASFFHHGLLEAYRSTLRADTLAQLRQRLSNVQQELEDWPDFHIEYIKFRDQKISELTTGDTRDDLLCLHSEIDEKLEQYLRLQQSHRNQELNSADALRQWADIENYVETRKQDIRDRIPTLGTMDTLAAADEAVQESVKHLLELHAERQAAEGQITDEESSVRQVTPEMVRTSLHMETSNLRRLLRLAARYGKVSECSISFGGKSTQVSPTNARDCLAEIISFDPTLFDNPSAKRYGQPKLCLLPGTGHGVYDEIHNRFIIPQHHTGSLSESIANAIVLYRLHIDSACHKHRLLRSFERDIAENRKIQSNLKLRMNFTANYLAWATDETQGREPLTRETREWFEENIAPQKRAPWVPEDIRRLNARQLNALFSRESTKPESAEQLYRLGVIAWKMDASVEHLKQNAIPKLAQAIQIEPDNLGYIYSAATMYMKVQNFQKAIELFSKFAANSKQSWWTKKATELCSHCR
ncbi:hypothetical protein OAU50_01000 [Planctomycetota bacterium]|nr:hypothetical protein [Planctomycetota bacterium]